MEKLLHHIRCKIHIGDNQTPLSAGLTSNALPESRANKTNALTNYGVHQ